MLFWRGVPAAVAKEKLAELNKAVTIKSFDRAEEIITQIEGMRDSLSAKERMEFDAIKKAVETAKETHDDM